MKNKTEELNIKLQYLKEFRKFLMDLPIPWYDDSLKAFNMNKEKIIELNRRIKQIKQKIKELK